MRTFIALDIKDEAVLEKINRIQSMIHERGADARYVDTHSLHFTICFLGEISDETMERVKRALSNVKARKVRVQYRGIGAFPGQHRINVIWLGVDNNCTAELRSIADQVNNAVSTLGFRSERTFQPHVTIARIKSRINRDRLVSLIGEYRDEKFGEETLDSVRLKKSILTPKGPVYEDLQSIRLDD